jgi:hypothetical protein
VSEAQTRTGRLPDALPLLHDAASTSAAILAVNPSDNLARAYLGESWLRLGETERRLSHTQSACAAFRSSLDAFEELERRSALRPEEKNLFVAARAGAGECGASGPARAR